MNSLLIAFLVTLGAATWIYTKMMKTSGGLTKNAMIVAGVSSLIVFIVVYSFVSMFA